MKKIIFLLSLIFLINLVASSCDSNQVDINTASKTDLDKLSGIGEAKAQSIIDSRPFNSIDDLINVNGIGDATLQKIKDQGLACVSSESSSKEDEEDSNSDEKVKVTKNYMEETQQEKTNNKETETVINLNSEVNILDSSKQEVVYESKNEKVKKYLIYAFCIFLLIVLGIVLIKG